MSAVPGYKHVYKYMKIQGPWVQRNYIIERDQKSDLHGKIRRIWFATQSRDQLMEKAHYNKTKESLLFTQKSKKP